MKSQAKHYDAGLMFRRKPAPEPQTTVDPWRSISEIVACRRVKPLLETAIAQGIELSQAASKGWAVLRGGTDKVAASKGYGVELMDLEVIGPWLDGTIKISTNHNLDLFGPNSPEVRARLTSAGLREVRAQLIAPLRANGELRGALILDAYGNESFSPVALENVGRMAGVVSQQMEMISEVERLYNLSAGLTHAFVEANEAQDFAQLGHGSRVATYALAMSQELELSQTEQRDVWFAAMLHDLGKLLRRDLNEGEHASLGYNLLASVSGLDAARLGVLHHHEHWDGTGIPNNLRGNEIPLAARIVATSNAFDHLTSERGETLSVREALARMREQSGRELDPNLVPILERILAQNKTTAELNPSMIKT